MVYLLMIFINSPILGSTKPASHKTNDYHEWKRSLLKKWKKEDITSDLGQKSELLSLLEPVVYAEKIPGKRKHMVFAYNLLLEYLEKSGRVDPIIGTYKRVSKYTDIPSNFVKDLIQDFRDEEHNHVWLLSKVFSQPKGERLTIYNSLRETWKLPKIKSANQIDKTWLDSTALYYHTESHNLLSPSDTERQLLKKIKRLTGCKDTILLKSKDHASSMSTSVPSNKKQVIGLKKHHDLSHTLFDLYHELCHVIHKDPMNCFLVDFGKKEASFFLRQASMKKTARQLATYTELGKTAFGPYTRRGKIVQFLLAKFPTFWNPPQDKTVAQAHLYKRMQEIRADLFACAYLYKTGHINAILSEIEGMFPWLEAESAMIKNDDAMYENALKSMVVREETDDDHPSHFEIMLYDVGFLVSKGIDVEKALDEWSNQGECIPLQ